MARQSDKRIASENAATLRLLKYGFIAVHLLQWLCFMIFPSQRREGRLLGYALSTVPSGLIYAQIVLMSTPKTSPTGVITSPGEDLSQPGLTQYMLDVIFVTWAAQTLAIVWSKAWLLYLSIPVYAGYKVFRLVKPILASKAKEASAMASAQTSGARQQGGSANIEGLSKRQQKLHARYEKGDRRYQMMEKPAT